MGENRQYDLDTKWDAAVDLTLRRVCYSTLAGAAAGLVLLRSPVTRWAAVAFGAGIGIGSAYTECSQSFGGPLTKWTPPKLPSAPASEFSLGNSEENWCILRARWKDFVYLRTWGS
ncbi:hypothetical protein ACHQM5_017527 [Ranunculus cassubicifolius]